MDRPNATNQNRLVRPIQRKHNPKASTKDPPLSKPPTNVHAQASSRNIFASNFRGNLDSNKMMAQLGLDEAFNYVELKNGDCFIQEIDDLLYCALCFQKFSISENNQRNAQYSRISAGDSGQRNAQFPRLTTSDTNPENHHLCEHSSDRHLDAFRHLMSKLKYYTPGLESMNMITLRHLVAQWIDDNHLTDDQVNSRLIAIDDFAAILDEVDPQCQYRIIGSFATGTTLSSSNVNLELLHPNNKLFEKDPRSKNSIHHKLIDPNSEYGSQINNHTMHYDLIANASDTLYKLAKRIEHNYLSIKTFSLVRQDFCSELSAKTPKLTLRHEPSQITLEILCYADARYQMDCLISHYISLDKRVSQLCILVKQWAKLCRVSNPGDGTFSPETWVILVIHFLQRTQPPVLPCLHDELLRNESHSRKRLESTSESLDNEPVRHNDTPPRRSESKIENNETIDDVDNDIEEEPDDDIAVYDLDQAMVDGLDWASKNADPLHKLFIDFFKFSMNEFSNTGTVISIVTKGKVSINDKKWKTNFKCIENPIRPCNNLSKNVCSIRTYEYIKRCFAIGYFYLTSIPMNENLKARTKQPSQPYHYIKLFFNLNRYVSYLNMTKQRFEDGKKRNVIDEMIQQKLFARDVGVVQKLMEYSIENRRDIESVAQTVARHYNQRFLLPTDVESTTFCWLCRRFGHVKLDCPKRRRKSINFSRLDLYIDTINFDTQFIELYEKDAISAAQSNRHLAIVEELEQSICSGTSLDCTLRLFGSTVNSLGSVDSDMDICMTLRDKPNGRDVNCIMVLKKTVEALSQNQHVTNIEAILAARVPIIKFKYDDYAVDLSMYNECAIHNSRLLRTYVSLDMRVAQLCYLVKRFARGCGIADASRGSLSSYAWNLMVVHFLQQTNPPILPVLQSTIEPRPVFGVNGWNVWFDESFDASLMIPNDQSLTSLLKEFLLYYSRFDFDQYVVSIRTNKILTKFKKNWTHCMIAIEDPFELTYNLAGSLQDQMAVYILESFPKTYEFICDFQIRVRRSEYPTLDALRSLFNGREIMGGDPPNRGCRHCGKIGHRFKDCPGKQFKSSG